MDTKMEMKKRTDRTRNRWIKQGKHWKKQENSLFAKMVTGVLTNEANPRPKRKAGARYIKKHTKMAGLFFVQH